jgi:hypothetical protein
MGDPSYDWDIDEKYIIGTVVDALHVAEMIPAAG